MPNTMANLAPLPTAGHSYETLRKHSTVLAGRSAAK